MTDMEQFTELEAAVIGWFTDRYGDTALAEQLRTAVLVSREYTGHGWYIRFQVDHATAPTDTNEHGHRWPLWGPVIESAEIDYNGQALLWGDGDGWANCIELFAYGDRFPEVVTTFLLLSVDAFNAKQNARQPSGGHTFQTSGQRHRGLATVGIQCKAVQHLPAPSLSAHCPSMQPTLQRCPPAAAHQGAPLRLPQAARPPRPGEGTPFRQRHARHRCSPGDRWYLS